MMNKYLRGCDILGGKIKPAGKHLHVVGSDTVEGANDGQVPPVLWGVFALGIAAAVGAGLYHLVRK